MSDFTEHLKKSASQTNQRLIYILDNYKTAPLAEPIRYVMQGGKRMRAFLALEGARLFDFDSIQAEYCATAIECIHACSLVHDDLPCMDDDDLRRGKPTIHAKWDEATAVLVGDALQFLAFEILLNPIHIKNLQSQATLAHRLAIASGVRGMVGGQALDIAAELPGANLTLQETEELQELKTGALIVWAAECGPILAGEDITPLGNYARSLGLAYQIKDDLLDISGNQNMLGKTVGKDDKAGKKTIVTILGKQKARKFATELIESAIASLDQYGAKADMLRNAASFVIKRDF